VINDGQVQMKTTTTTTTTTAAAAGKEAKDGDKSMATGHVK